MLLLLVLFVYMQESFELNFSALYRRCVILLLLLLHMVLWLLFRYSTNLCMCLCVRYIYACLFLHYFLFFWLLLYFFCRNCLNLMMYVAFITITAYVSGRCSLTTTQRYSCVRSLFICFLISFNDKKKPKKGNLFFEYAKNVLFAVAISS